MAQPMAVPYTELADANGAPLAGGKIYTYAAGTTTPQASYTDSTGTTPAANPVILDSAGRATVWLSGYYKIVVTDANDVVIRTTDNVTALGATGDMNKSVYDPANIQEQLVGLTAVQTITNKTINDPAYVDVASAATTDIGAAASMNVRITGTVTITNLGTANAGITRRVRFAGALTLTYNASSLIIPTSADIVTAADDTMEATSLGAGNWFITRYNRKNGTPVGGTSYKVGSISRDTSTASGSVAYTGVGFKPKAIHVFGGVVGTTKYTMNGFSDGTTQRGMADNGPVSAGTYDDTGALIYIINSSGGNFTAGTLTSFDADGFTVSWAKTGSPTGTAVIYYLAMR